MIRPGTTARMSLVSLLCLLALPFVVAGAALACDPKGAAADWKRVEANGTVVAYVTRPARIPLGEPFEMDLAICVDRVPAGLAPAGLALPRVDAWMPAHRHGMNYRPGVTEIEAGRYSVRGLLFHMRGRWEFRFDVPVDGKAQQLTAPVDVE